MTSKTYIQVKDLPDSPKGTRWISGKNSGYYYTEKHEYGSTVYEEEYLISHPDFWEVEVKKRWKPAYGEKYYIVVMSDFDFSFIDCLEWTDSNSDDLYYNSYNCFKTREEAEAMAKKVLELLKKEGEK